MRSAQLYTWHPWVEHGWAVRHNVALGLSHAMVGVEDPGGFWGTAFTFEETKKSITIKNPKIIKILLTKLSYKNFWLNANILVNQ